MLHKTWIRVWCNSGTEWPKTLWMSRKMKSVDFNILYQPDRWVVSWCLMQRLSVKTDLKLAKIWLERKEYARLEQVSLGSRWTWFDERSSLLRKYGIIHPSKPIIKLLLQLLIGSQCCRSSRSCIPRSIARIPHQPTKVCSNAAIQSRPTTPSAHCYWKSWQSKFRCTQIEKKVKSFA